MRSFFIITILVCSVISANAQCYVSSPDGALAFSSLESYDLAVKAYLKNDQEKFKILIKDNKIRILAPGTPIHIQSKTKLVAAVTTFGSSKLWAVPVVFITCK